MAKLWKKFTYRTASKSYNSRRFYTMLDMAEIKHQEAIKASQIKRGEREDKGNNYISVCGCGMEGCFIHGQFDSIPQEEFNKWKENQRMQQTSFPKRNTTSF